MSNTDLQEMKNDVQEVKEECKKLKTYNPEHFAEEYEYIRKNYKDVIEDGLEILKNLKEFCRDGDSPGAYQAAGSLVSSVINANKDLFELQKEMDSIYESENAIEEDNEKQSSNMNVEHADNVMVVGGTMNEIKEFLDNAKSSKSK